MGKTLDLETGEIKMVEGSNYVMMEVEATIQLGTDTQLTYFDKIVFVILSAHLGWKTRKVLISQTDLARMMGVTRQEINRSMRKLLRAGYLEQYEGKYAVPTWIAHKGKRSRPALERGKQQGLGVIDGDRNE